MIKRLFLSIISITAALFANANEIKLADPTIFYSNGIYYLTGTGDTANGFTMYKSTDLVHWQRCGNATGGRALYKGDTYGTGDFWAPQIFAYGGAYYMAYAANQQIAIAKSDSPEGPYKQTVQKELNHTTGQIDPYVFIDDDGKKYIYYVRFIGGNALYVGELTDDFQNIKEETITHCISAENNTWEMSPNTPIARVAEGPTVIKDGGYYYLIYSANHFENIDYSVGYAYSTSPTGPWKKIGRPFLSRHNTGINGSGHGDMVRNDKGEWFYVFHVHASNSTVQPRRTVLVPITLTDDPENKFIPEVDRMIILNDAASVTTKLPDSPEKFEADGISYTVTNSAMRLAEVSCKDAVLFGGYSGEIDIPKSVSNNGTTYEVKSIGTGAFYNCPDLKKVNLSDGLTKIDVGAFENSGIRSIEIPQTVTMIGYRAFADCDELLDVISKRTAARRLIAGTFSETTLKNGKLWVPEGASNVYKSTVGWSDFVRISGIDAGNILEDFAVDGIYYKILSEEDATCLVSAHTAQYATYRGPELTVPANVDSNGKTYSVTGVGRMAFKDSRLVEKISLPEGIETLGTYAMSGLYNLKEITIPSTVTSISTYCFRGCSGLTSVTCLAETPPTAGVITTFDKQTYNGTLFVPYGKKSDYMAAPVWGNFINIVEMEPSSIRNLTPASSDSSDVYTIQGVKVDGRTALPKGIYIIGGKKTIIK
jgi:xylan 1,4-beta-xylosidase